MRRRKTLNFLNEEEDDDDDGWGIVTNDETRSIEKQAPNFQI